MPITRIKGNAVGRCKTVTANNLVWTVATAPGGDVAQQTKAALDAIEANLNEVGTDKQHIV